MLLLGGTSSHADDELGTILLFGARLSMQKSSRSQTSCYHAVTLGQQLWHGTQNRLAAGMVVAVVVGPSRRVPPHYAHGDPKNEKQPGCALALRGAFWRDQTPALPCLPQNHSGPPNQYPPSLAELHLVIIIIIISWLCMGQMGIVIKRLATNAVPNPGDDSEPILEGNPEPFPLLVSSAFLTPSLTSCPIGLAKVFAGDLGPLNLKPPYDEDRHRHAEMAALLAEGGERRLHLSRRV